MSGHIKSPEDIINFLLLVIKSSDGFKANYHQVAMDAKINTAMNAQRKLKSVAESNGYKLVDGAIVATEGVREVPDPGVGEKRKRSKLKSRGKGKGKGDVDRDGDDDEEVKKIEEKDSGDDEKHVVVKKRKVDKMEAEARRL